MARLVIDMPTELRVRPGTGTGGPRPCADGNAEQDSLSPDVRRFLSWFACWSPISR
ncbi:MAG: hypothetical protein ACOCPX_02300 [Halapricum sp.]